MTWLGIGPAAPVRPPVSWDSGAITSDAPVLSLAQEWNDGGEVFSAFRIDVTNTASASGSRFAEMLLGGADRFYVEAPSGRVVADSFYGVDYGYGNYPFHASGAGGILRADNAHIALHGSSGGFIAGSDRGLIWAENTGWYNTKDTGIMRSAAGIAEINNGTSGAYRDLRVRALLAAGGTITTSYPLIDGTQTWNDGAVTFTAIRADITSTAAAVDSNLIDLQIGSQSRFRVTQLHSSGRIKINAEGSRVNLAVLGGYPLFLGPAPSDYVGGSGTTFFGNGSYHAGGNHWIYGFFVPRGSGFCFLGSPGNTIAMTPDFYLIHDGTACLAQRGQASGTTAQTFRVYRTYTDGSNYERMAFQSGSGYMQIAAETAGTGTDDIDIRLTPSGAGVVYTISPLQIASGTLTANIPGINLSQTWDNGSVTFTGIKANYTWTAGNVASKLIDLQMNGSSYFAVERGDSYGPVLTTTGPNGFRLAARLVVAAVKETNISALSASFGYNGIHFEGITGDVAIAFRGNWGYDQVVGALRITGCDQYASPTTNLIGGHVYIAGGAGASGSAGAAHGGSLYLDGGQGYGTGSHGDIVVGNTRGFLDIKGSDAAAAQTATMTNGPTAGNPAEWMPIKFNGNVRYVPVWA